MARREKNYEVLIRDRELKIAKGLQRDGAIKRERLKDVPRRKYTGQI